MADGADLVAALALEQVDGGTWAGPATAWSGPAPGGLLVGQAVVAALWARPGRRPWSAQVVFTRPVTPGPVCTFAVDVVHDGRAVTACRVTAAQGGEVRAVGLVTLGDDDRAADAGPERSRRPPDVAPPERCLDWEELRLESEPDGAGRRPSPVEVRVDPDPSVDEHGTTSSYAWLRTHAPLPPDPAVHAGGPRLRHRPDPAPIGRPARALAVRPPAGPHPEPHGVVPPPPGVERLAPPRHHVRVSVSRPRPRHRNPLRRPDPHRHHRPRRPHPLVTPRPIGHRLTGHG